MKGMGTGDRKGWGRWEKERWGYIEKIQTRGMKEGKKEGRVKEERRKR